VTRTSGLCAGNVSMTWLASHNSTRSGSEDGEGLRTNGTSRTDVGEVSGTGVTSLEAKRSESEHDG